MVTGRIASAKRRGRPDPPRSERFSGRRSGQGATGATITVEGTELYVSVSMGISLFPQDADDANTLQRNAEAAMYESKKHGPAGYAVSSRGAPATPVSGVSAVAPATHRPPPPSPPPPAP